MLTLLTLVGMSDNNLDKTIRGAYILVTILFVVAVVVGYFIWRAYE